MACVANKLPIVSNESIYNLTSRRLYDIMFISNLDIHARVSATKRLRPTFYTTNRYRFVSPKHTLSIPSIYTRIIHTECPATILM